MAFPFQLSYSTLFNISMQFLAPCRLSSGFDRDSFPQTFTGILSPTFSYGSSISSLPGLVGILPLPPQLEFRPKLQSQYRTCSLLPVDSLGDCSDPYCPASSLGPGLIRIIHLMYTQVRFDPCDFPSFFKILPLFFYFDKALVCSFPVTLQLFH